MGEVYRARDTKLNREVAIKVLPERLARDPDALARFEREAQAVAALTHPNIMAIHDFGVNAGVAYAVTELLEGETLRAKLAALGAPHAQGRRVRAADRPRDRRGAREGRRPSRSEAGEHLHHGRRAREDPRLRAGEGWSRRRARSACCRRRAASASSPGTVMGTVGYMSPEQVRGQAVDHRTDIFSFGVVLLRDAHRAPRVPRATRTSRR